MNSRQKRKRGLNFSKEEQILLLDEIKKLKKIIENKAIDRVSCNKKLQAWKLIAIRFNSQASVKRSLAQLQAKYENLKTEVRKVVANKKLELREIGGVPLKGITDDPVLLTVMDLTNHKTVVGLTSNIDNDAVEIGSTSLVLPINEESNIDSIAMDDSTEVLRCKVLPQPFINTSSYEINNSLQITEEIKIEPIVMDDPTEVLSCNVLPQPFINTSSYEINNSSPIKEEVNIDPIVLHDSTEVLSCKVLPQPLFIDTSSYEINNSSKESSESSESSASSDNQQANLPTLDPCKRTPTEVVSDGWTGNTHRNLKKTVNFKLRSKVSNTIEKAKAKYYETKLHLLEMQRVALERREQRAEEEHKKKMILLELNIQIQKRKN